ncbi:MAG TPA: hypothetical protein VGB36_00270 [Gammaproteobacteria bacterium]|jgi:hypothetical protein
MSELLDPVFKDFRTAYENEFAGIVSAPVTYDDLVVTRDVLVKSLRNDLTSNEREFLLSIKAAEPRWEFMELPGIETLPAIQWKLANIENMKPAKRRKAYKQLQAVLER